MLFFCFIIVVLVILVLVVITLGYLLVVLCFIQVPVLLVILVDLAAFLKHISLVDLVNFDPVALGNLRILDVLLRVPVLLTLGGLLLVPVLLVELVILFNEEGDHASPHIMISLQSE